MADAHKTPATAFRLSPETNADLDYLAARLRTTRAGAVREAVRRLAQAERRAEKKLPENPPTGIPTGDTNH